MRLSEYLNLPHVTQASLAQRLGVSQGAVSHWLNGRSTITAERAKEIEAATDYLVTRYELRPDIFDRRTNQDLKPCA